MTLEGSASSIKLRVMKDGTSWSMICIPIGGFGWSLPKQCVPSYVKPFLRWKCSITGRALAVEGLWVPSEAINPSLLCLLWVLDE